MVLESRGVGWKRGWLIRAISCADGDFIFLHGGGGKGAHTHVHASGCVQNYLPRVLYTQSDTFAANMATRRHRRRSRRTRRSHRRRRSTSSSLTAAPMRVAKNTANTLGTQIEGVGAKVVSTTQKSMPKIKGVTRSWLGFLTGKGKTRRHRR